MSDKFVVSTNEIGEIIVTDVETGKVYDNLYKFFGLIRLMNEQQARIKELEKENEQLQKETVFLAYWKRKAMILLMQVRRLTPRMTDKEVMEFSKELDDE